MTQKALVKRNALTPAQMTTPELIQRQGCVPALGLVSMLGTGFGIEGLIMSALLESGPYALLFLIIAAFFGFLTGVILKRDIRRTKILDAELNRRPDYHQLCASRDLRIVDGEIADLERKLEKAREQRAELQQKLTALQSVPGYRD